LDGTLDGDDLPFVVVVAAWAVIELLREGPTAEMAVTQRFGWTSLQLGEGYGQEKDGRGICLVF